MQRPSNKAAAWSAIQADNSKNVFNNNNAKLGGGSENPQESDDGSQQLSNNHPHPSSSPATTTSLLNHHQGSLSLGKTNKINQHHGNEIISAVRLYEIASMTTPFPSSNNPHQHSGVGDSIVGKKAYGTKGQRQEVFNRRAKSLKKAETNSSSTSNCNTCNEDQERMLHKSFGAKSTTSNLIGGPQRENAADTKTAKNIDL